MAQRIKLSESMLKKMIAETVGEAFNFDGAEKYQAVKNPTYTMDIDNFRNDLAHKNPEARRQMSNVLKKSRGSFANIDESEYVCDKHAQEQEQFRMDNGEYYRHEDWYVEAGENQYNTEKRDGFDSKEEAEEFAAELKADRPDLKYISVGCDACYRTVDESKTNNMNTNKIRITESQLKKMISETVSEIKNGWELEDDDITLVNGEGDGNKRYMVKLWWGSGYVMDCYNAFANSAEKALYYVVAWVEQNHPEWLETSDRYAEEMKQELADEKGIDTYEAEELPEFTETFMYVDATMEGASEPHYIFDENLQIAEYPEEHNYPMGRSMNENKIRITESQLKKMIKEAISELDWKTYANAARKWNDTLKANPAHPKRKSSIIGHENSKGTHDIDTDDRLRAFQQAASDSFNDEFGYNVHQKDGDDGSYQMSSKYGNGINQQSGYYDNIQTTTRTPQGSKGKGQMRDTFHLDSLDGHDKYPSKRHEAHIGLDNYSGHGNFPAYSERDAVEPEWDKLPYMAARNKGNAEIEKYQNGDYYFDQMSGKWSDDAENKNKPMVVPDGDTDSLPQNLQDKLCPSWQYGASVYADGELQDDLGFDIVHFIDSDSLHSAFEGKKEGDRVPCRVYGVDRPCEMVFSGKDPMGRDYVLIRYKEDGNEKSDIMERIVKDAIRKALR